jgi:hypothetical protein
MSLIQATFGLMSLLTSLRATACTPSQRPAAWHPPPRSTGSSWSPWLGCGPRADTFGAARTVSGRFGARPSCARRGTRRSGRSDYLAAIATPNPNRSTTVNIQPPQRRWPNTMSIPTRRNDSVCRWLPRCRDRGVRDAADTSAVWAVSAAQSGGFEDDCPSAAATGSLAGRYRQTGVDRYPHGAPGADRGFLPRPAGSTP